MDIGTTPASRCCRIWRFGDAEFDEGSLELRVGGETVPIELKPLGLLAALLSLDGDVATKDELSAAIWPGVTVGDGSLTNAVSKLRAALGDHDRMIIRPVPKVGYRIGIPVTCCTVARGETSPPLPFLAAGDSVRDRPRWRLVRPLGDPASNRWLGRHQDTGDQRVFRFANDAAELDALKHEALVSSRLHGAAHRPGFVRVLEDDFERRPYMIESTYGGVDLRTWAADGGRLLATPLTERLALAARVARIVAEAHQIGVVHGRISPASVLIAEDGTTPLVSVAGFGGADTSAGRSPRATTTGDDIQALGRLLLGLAAGDLDRSALPGWESQIASSLLASDISSALLAGSATGIASAAELAERLENLDARVRDIAAEEARRTSLARLQERMLRARQRRPWLILAGLCLVFGLLGTSVAAMVAFRESNQARRAAAVADATRRFLSNDLLASGAPGGQSAAELVVETVTQADDRVDARFAADRRLAGSIHLALANTLALRSIPDGARRAYQAAITDFAAAGAEGAEDLVIARARAALAEAQSLDAGSIMRARDLVAAARAGLSATGARRIEADVDLLAADAMISWVGGDPKHTHDLLVEASTLASGRPDVIDIDQRLMLKRVEASSLMRMGRWNESEPMLRALLPQYMTLEGPAHPETLLIRFNLAQVMMLQGRTAEAVEAFDALRPQFVDVFGPTHRYALELVEQRANALEQMGRYDEAMRDAQVLYRAAVTRSGERSYMAAGLLSDLADIECRGGRTEEGIAASRQAYTVSRLAMGESSGATQALKSTAVFCLATGGRFADALALLSTLNQKAGADFMAEPTLPAEMDLVRAASALAGGDRARAAALLAEPRRVFLLPGADPFDERWTRRLVAQSVASELHDASLATAR